MASTSSTAARSLARHLSLFVAGPSTTPIRTARRSITRQPLRTTAVSSRHFQHHRLLSSTSRSLPTKSCPTCSSAYPLTVSPCPNCRTLLPIPSSMSYFALFDLCPPLSGVDQSGAKEELETMRGGGFDIDTKDLRMRFLKRQQGVHPDSYSGQEEKAASLADSQSSLLNKAYYTLLDPLSRAQYLLELHGLPIEETDSLTDPELLMEILDARESLEDAQSEEDMEKVRAANSGRTQHTISLLSQAFAANPPDVERAKQLTVELRYLRNLEEAAKEWRMGERVEIRH